MSLGRKSETEIYNYCIENDCIALGWGKDIKYKNGDSKKEIEDKVRKFYKNIGNDFNQTDVQQINQFINSVKIEDVILVPSGIKRIRAIGIVEGDYEYRNLPEIEYHHYRSVKWLYSDEEGLIPVERLIRERGFRERRWKKLYMVPLYLQF